MENKPKRPPSVWIAQTIIVTLAVVFMAPLPMILLDSGPSRFGKLPVGLPLGAAIYSGVAILLLVSFWGLTVRKSYGRWMAVGIITIVFAGLLLICILMAFYSPATARPPIFVLLEVVIFVALLLLLIVRLAFGKRVAAFFNQSDAEPPVHEPPPPPSFDSDGK